MLRYQTDGNILVIAPRLKRIDVFSSPDLRKEIQEVIEQTGSENVILDLASVEFIDSAGLVGLLALWKNLRKKNGELKVVGVQLQVRQIIDLVLLNRVFAIYETIEDAKEAFLLSFKEEKQHST